MKNKEKRGVKYLYTTFITDKSRKIRTFVRL